MKPEIIARVAHQINKAYCEAMGHEEQPTWENAPQEQKDSLLSGVRFHVANPDATPADSHESWLKGKRKDGWSFGVVKDIDLRTHPCIKPFEKLSESQKAKDFLFLTVVHELKDL